MIAALVSAWLVGVFGGFHCMAMCGGFSAAIATREKTLREGSSPLLPARAIVCQQLTSQAGRLMTYVLLGSIFGAIGAASMRAIDLLPLQKTLYVVANLFLAVLALGVATRHTHGSWLQRAGTTAFSPILAMLRPLLRRPDFVGRLALGMLWGLVPCAMVYSILPLALFAGGPLEGGAVLLAFGLGTLPNLLVAGVLFDRVHTLFGGTTMRRAAAGTLLAFAVAGIYRAVYMQDGLAHGAFCLVP